MQLKTILNHVTDYIDNPEPRECVIVGKCVVRETKERLLYVSNVPPLPGELVGASDEISSVLLGQIDTRLSLSDIGRHPFMVDIYVLKNFSSRDDCTVSDIERIGCGLLHAKIEDAVAASPIGD